MSRKAVRYFKESTKEVERQNILKELETRNALYFLGDDASSEGLTVAEAYAKALAALDTNTLYRPKNG